ncbi:MAG TPA: tetratricopeptide repeat protein [Thermoanaerobaculia bacterium]|nr:tetratricopeptide repeat protein [Thermoanaerobaculia bacterium]
MDRETRRSIKHDKFIDEMQVAASFARRNQRLVIGGAIAILLIIGLVVGLFAWQRRNEEKAQVALADAIAAQESPLKSEGDSTIARARYETAEERASAAEAMFRQVVDQYGGSDAADVARLYLAQIEAGRGKYDLARALLEAFAREHSDHVLAAGARLSLIKITLAEGKPQEAITEIERQLGETEKPLPADVLLAALAQAYELNGEPQKARDVYQRLVTEFPESAYSFDAQRKLAQG